MVLGQLAFIGSIQYSLLPGHLHLWHGGLRHFSAFGNDVIVDFWFSQAPNCSALSCAAAQPCNVAGTTIVHELSEE